MKKKKPDGGPKIHVIAVPYQKDFRKFGDAMAAALNSLANDGFSIEQTSHPGGVILAGIRRSPHPFEELIMGGLPQRQTPDPTRQGGKAADEDVEQDPISERTLWILRRCLSGIDKSNPETFPPAIERNCPPVLKDLVEAKGQTSEDLREIIKELEDDAANHRCDVPGCHMAKASALVAEKFKQHLYKNVS